MTEDGDIPTVDEEDFDPPDDPIFGGVGELEVNGEVVGDVTDFDVELSASGYSKAAETLTESFDAIGEAVRSAMWHTLIDAAGHEAFVDDLSVDDFRDAIHRLQSNGYAADKLTTREIYGDPDERPTGAAFFAGVGAADKWEGIADDMVRVNDDTVDATGDFLPSIDGFVVERVSDIPTNLIVGVDVDALARVPGEARNVPVGADETPAVSSPIVVRDEDGVVVVNVAEE